jgi:transcription antitermination protein NusB
VSDERAAARARRRARQRGAARLAAVQALFQMDRGGTDLIATLADFETHRLDGKADGEQLVAADREFFRELVTGVVESQRRIDPVIHKSLIEGWPLRRLDLTLRAILRAGAYEIIERPDIPPRVSITEYVDVAHAFFQDGEEPGMVNAVLDRVARQVRGEDLAAGGVR